MVTSKCPLIMRNDYVLEFQNESPIKIETQSLRGETPFPFVCSRVNFLTLL